MVYRQGETDMLHRSFCPVRLSGFFWQKDNYIFTDICSCLFVCFFLRICFFIFLHIYLYDIYNVLYLESIFRNLGFSSQFVHIGTGISEFVILENSPSRKKASLSSPYTVFIISRIVCLVKSKFVCTFIFQLC